MGRGQGPYWKRRVPVIGIIGERVIGNRLFERELADFGTVRVIFLAQDQKKPPGENQGKVKDKRPAIYAMHTALIRSDVEVLYWGIPEKLNHTLTDHERQQTGLTTAAVCKGFDP